MHPIEIVRGFVTDIVRLPVVFKLGLAWFAVGWVWQRWKARARRQIEMASTAWPVHRARVVWAQVSEARKEGRHGASYWQGLLTYSYTVPGCDLEVGELRRRFYDEAEADAWARALRETSGDVRVNPANPKQSVWMEQLAMSNPETQLSDIPALRSIPPESSGSREMAAWTLLSVSVAGAAISSWIQVSCLLGRPVMTPATNSQAFFGMHIGAMLCAVGTGLLAGKKSLGGGRFGIGSANTSPLMKVLGGYCALVFIYGWARISAKDGNSDLWSVLIFSCAWVLFYASSAIGSWRVLRAAPQAAS